MQQAISRSRSWTVVTQFRRTKWNRKWYLGHNWGVKELPPKSQDLVAALAAQPAEGDQTPCW